ncbi:hypothetical protein GCM10018782_35690 [Streptomyces griseoaurantiacus]|nr:hypothetical protein GCM10018782_35690 [Streptomyces griseoaurantiacus]
MPMNTGSVLAYEPTHSIATNGATRQRPMTTRRGVTAPLPTPGASDMCGSVPSLVNRQCGGKSRSPRPGNGTLVRITVGEGNEKERSGDGG